MTGRYDILGSYKPRRGAFQKYSDTVTDTRLLTKCKEVGIDLTIGEGKLLTQG